MPDNDPVQSRAPENRATRYFDSDAGRSNAFSEALVTAQSNNADGSSPDRPIRVNGRTLSESTTVDNFFHALGVDAFVLGASGKVGVDNIPGYTKIPGLRNIARDANITYLGAILTPFATFEGDHVSLNEIKLTARPLDSTLFLLLKGPEATDNPFIITSKPADLNVEIGRPLFKSRLLFDGAVIIFGNGRVGPSFNAGDDVAQGNASLNGGFLVRFNGARDLMKGMDTVLRSAARAAQVTELGAGALAAPQTGGASLAGGAAAAGATELGRQTLSNALLSANWYVGAAWRAQAGLGIAENGDVTFQAQRGKLQNKWVIFNVADMPESMLGDIMNKIPDISAEPNGGGRNTQQTPVGNNAHDQPNQNMTDFAGPFGNQSYPMSEIEDWVRMVNTPSDTPAQEPGGAGQSPDIPAPLPQEPQGGAGNGPVTPSQPGPAAPDSTPAPGAGANPATPAGSGAGSPTPQQPAVPSGGVETDEGGTYFFGDLYNYADDTVTDYIPPGLAPENGGDPAPEPEYGPPPPPEQPDTPADPDEDDTDGTQAPTDSSGGQAGKPVPDEVAPVTGGPTYPNYNGSRPNPGNTTPVPDEIATTTGGTVYPNYNGSRPNPGNTTPVPDEIALPSGANFPILYNSGGRVSPANTTPLPSGVEPMGVSGGYGVKPLLGPDPRVMNIAGLDTGAYSNAFENASASFDMSGSNFISIANRDIGSSSARETAVSGSTLSSNLNLDSIGNLSAGIDGLGRF